MKALDKLNNYLKIFNQTSGEYLNLIGDYSKPDITPTGTVKINDTNKGAISNVLEYERATMNFFIAQLTLSNTVDDYLDFIGETYYGLQRNQGEVDNDYYTRILNSIFSIKCTKPAIYNAIQSYGTNIRIEEGANYGAFCDASYCDSIKYFDIEGQPVIQEAVCEAVGGIPFFFIIIADFIPPENLAILINILDNYKACGIKYSIQSATQVTLITGFADLLYTEYNFYNFSNNPVILRGFAQ